MIIDAHTHVPLDRKDWSLFFRICRANSVSAAIASSLGVTNWPEYPSSEIISGSNELAYEFARDSNGLVHWLAYLNPQNKNWDTELDTCLAKGAIGIKLWVSLRSDDNSLANCLPILDTAGQKNLPVLIHSFNRRAPLFRGEINTFEFASLAKRFPKTTMIEAHAGSNWHLGLHQIKDLPNVYVDISGYFPQRTMLEEIVAVLGPERVLFGSDGFVRDQNAQLAKVYFSSISDQQKQLILRTNAEKVYGIKANSKFKINSLISIQPSKKPVFDYSLDHFCFCGNWPFLESSCTIDHLNTELLRNNTIAYVANADSIYSADPSQANKHFFEISRPFGNMRPLATLNPLAANWQWMLEEYRGNFAGGFVSPYLHDWSLDDDACKEFFEICAKLRFPLWINCGLGDNRLYPKGIDFRPVSDDELSWFAKHAPMNQYVFQALSESNIYSLLNAQSQRTDIKCEISRLTDFSNVLPPALARAKPGTLVFGSEFPLRAMKTVRFSAESILQQSLPPSGSRIRSIKAAGSSGSNRTDSSYVVDN